MNVSSALFDFSPFAAQRDRAVELIETFLSHPAFRSAAVDELVLNEDFYRRPLRPEDLGILPFEEPVTADRVNALAGLASNRLLLSIYELNFARLPRARSAEEFARYTDFYSDRNQVLAAQLRPFLENYAFGYAGSELRADEAGPELAARLREVLQREADFWSGALGNLVRRDYLREGLAFSLVQRWCHTEPKRRAFARAAAAGFLDGLEAEERPRSFGAGEDEPALASLAASLGVERRPHSFWQFYLATTLAQSNLQYCLAARPDRALAFCGAAFVAEAEWLAFKAGVESGCRHIPGAEPEAESAQAQRELEARFERACQAVTERFGRAGVQLFGQGVAAAQRLGERARWDLGEQLSWLSHVNEYCRFARRIAARVQAECPNIDRETFVEPREMCSTTHVHDDHRLVVIESGDMVFWGNLGMQLKMTVGDMVLIPQGRLHGSTVVSAECTYHQPIIPDAWVQVLMRELETVAGPAIASV